MRTMVRFAGIALGLWASIAASEEFPSGDWAWSIDDPDVLYAATQNSTGQALMQLCYPSEGNCLYAVGFDTRCEQGSTYPALVNTDVSATTVELFCGIELDDGGNLLFFRDFDQIDALIRQARKIGFALPMEGDEFKAVRFSLKGSVTAIDAMRRVGERDGTDGRSVRKTKDSEVF